MEVTCLTLTNLLLPISAMHFPQYPYLNSFLPFWWFKLGETWIIHWSCISNHAGFYSVSCSACFPLFSSITRACPLGMFSTGIYHWPGKSFRGPLWWRCWEFSQIWWLLKCNGSSNSYCICFIEGVHLCISQYWSQLLCFFSNLSVYSYLELQLMKLRKKGSKLLAF